MFKQDPPPIAVERAINMLKQGVFVTPIYSLAWEEALLILDLSYLFEFIGNELASDLERVLRQRIFDHGSVA